MKTGWREPALHKKRDGWLMIRSDGIAHFLEPLWFQGAQIAYSGAWVKAWFACAIITLFGAGGRHGWRWGLLPSYGDWIYRHDDGRLSSLAYFIDADLKRREAKDHP